MEDEDPLDRKKFKVVFLDRLFSLEMGKDKLLELINLQKGSMNMFSCVSEIVVKESGTSILIKVMDISHLMCIHNKFRKINLSKV